MSLVLAMATATPQVSVALADDAGEVIGSIVLRQGRRHGESLAPSIEALLRLAGVEMASVGKVAVDVGPGLFTGLRVGVATAKALASALGVPLAAASSLDLLAYPHRFVPEPVISVVDARRGEVFWSRHDGGRGQDPHLSTPEELAEILAGRPGLLVGDGARRYAQTLAGNDCLVNLAGPESDHPSAAVLASIAQQLPAGEPEKVTPIYMRGPDVRIGWEQRGA